MVQNRESLLISHALSSIVYRQLTVQVYDDDNNKTRFIKEFERLIGIIEEDEHQESESHWEYTGTSALLKEVDDNNTYKVRDMHSLR